ncbi:MAG: SgcJ/EcaC family oxidoreductase [Anaerolineales bacterium]
MNEPIRELNDRVEAYQQAWNTHQASAVAAFFTPDADMIIGNGPRFVGREAIQNSWEGYFDKIAATRQGTFTVETYKMLTPDVAILNIHSTTFGHDAAGQEMPTRLARGTWVMVWRAGDWWISALRALPEQGELRLSPGTDV